MGQDRLNGLALLYAHSDIDINYGELMDILALDFRHRLQLINILDTTAD